MEFKTCFSFACTCFRQPDTYFHNLQFARRDQGGGQERVKQVKPVQCDLDMRLKKMNPSSVLPSSGLDN